MIENCLLKTKAQSMIYVKLRTLSLNIEYIHEAWLPWKPFRQPRLGSAQDIRTTDLEIECLYCASNSHQVM